MKKDIPTKLMIVLIAVATIILVLSILIITGHFEEV